MLGTGGSRNFVRCCQDSHAFFSIRENDNITNPRRTNLIIDLDPTPPSNAISSMRSDPANIQHAIRLLSVVRSARRIPRRPLSAPRHPLHALSARRTPRGGLCSPQPAPRPLCSALKRRTRRPCPGRKRRRSARTTNTARAETATAPALSAEVFPPETNTALLTPSCSATTSSSSLPTQSASSSVTAKDDSTALQF